MNMQDGCCSGLALCSSCGFIPPTRITYIYIFTLLFKHFFFLMAMLGKDFAKPRNHNYKMLWGETRRDRALPVSRGGGRAI